MHVRPATRADIYDVGTLADVTFQDDAFWRSLTPGMYDYPNDRTRFYRLRTRGRAVMEGGCVSLVVVTDEQDADWSGREKLAGYAFWQRQGTSEQARKWQREPWGARLNRALLWAEMQYERYVVNRAMDFKIWDEVMTMFAALKAPLVAEHWHTLVLGVAPQYRRRGAGRLLLDWGLQRAREEGVPVLLEATPQGVPLYEKAGFKRVLAVRARQFPSFVSTNMIWEPEGREGDWLTAAMVQQCRDGLREAPVVEVVSG
ncbi:MAG: hypothetical protein M1821_009887 [Bathelium mastoideum]|nr:MAG: hypothetical protein M1821_009887 [Bathelium mastoideum]KAI9690351.1 MAG: hypothetical protein M1822_009313 [Bathelium mastoideum]